MSKSQSVIDARRDLLRELRDHELVADVDFTRDGYQTLVVHMEDE